MGRLLKYLIIIYSVLILFIFLSYSLGIVSEQSRNTSLYSLYYLVNFLTLYVFPFFVIFMSAFYLFKEKQGYLKSLLIPISYTIVGFIIATIWYFNSEGGEAGMAFFIILPQIIVAQILSLIVNGIILVIIKKNSS